MTSFSYQTLISRLSQDKSCYSLLKLNDLIDFSDVGALLRKRKQSQRNDVLGKKHYDPLKRFKAILLGHCHSLSDEAPEHALIVSADFII